MSAFDVASLREHLTELKRRAKVVVASFVVLLLIFIAVPADPESLLSFNGTYVTFVAFFLQRIKSDILPANWILIANRLNEPLEVFLVGSVIFALLFNMPIFAYETFRFIDPALTKDERGMVYPFVISSSALFAFGCLFGYLFLAKALIVALSPFFVATGANPYIDLSDFFFVVFLTVVLSGVAFTIPVFIFILLRFGVVDPSFFKKNRIIIWFVTYIFTAIVTPDGGPLLDLILFVPIIVMVEVAVFLGGRYRRRVERRTGAGSGSGSGVAGAVTLQVAKCRYCSADLDPNSLFCPNCGRAKS